MLVVFPMSRFIQTHLFPQKHWKATLPKTRNVFQMNLFFPPDLCRNHLVPKRIHRPNRPIQLEEKGCHTPGVQEPSCLFQNGFTNPQESRRCIRWCNLLSCYTPIRLYAESTSDILLCVWMITLLGPNHLCGILEDRTVFPWERSEL